MKGTDIVKLKIFLAASMIAAASRLPAQEIDIVTDEPSVFVTGEEFQFTATAWEKVDEKFKEGKVVFKIQDSGGKKLCEDRTADLSKENPVKIKVKLDHPGFVLVSASPCTMPDGKVVKWKGNPFAPRGGAAVDPEKIRPGSECPKDFDEFWLEGIKSFQKAKIEVTDAPDILRKGYKVSRVKVFFPDGTGAVTGFLSVPSKPGKYPALAGVPGAGPGSAVPIPKWKSPVPAIELWLNVHNFDTAPTQVEQKKRYKAYRESLGGDYWLSGAESRDKYFYRNVWLAVNRAVDHVASLPEFDGKHFAMAGNSQGGGTALVIGSLNKNITCIVASVPALSDHGGWKLGRQAGWPQLHKKLNGKADETAPYFDAANFASRIRVPTLVSVGFIDTTCSPSSVYAAYNSIPDGVHKQICHMVRYGHSGAPTFRAAVNKFLSEQLSR